MSGDRDGVPLTGRVLVIGGAGSIGSHLVDRLLTEDVDVTVVDDLSGGSLANLAEARAVAAGRLSIEHLDAASQEFSILVARRRPSVIYLLAGVPGASGPVRALTDALERLAVVVDTAQRHGVAKVVVVVPASAIYGLPTAKELPAKEGAVIARGVRGVIVRAMVDLLETYRSDHAVEFTVIALASVYGPRCANGVVAEFAAAAADGRAPVITGDGRQTRDFVFVDDVVDALARAGSRGSGLVVNIGTGVQTRIVDLWTMIAGDTAAVPTFVPERPRELRRFAVSPVRARIHLGWSPWTELSAGLAQLA